MQCLAHRTRRWEEHRTAYLPSGRLSSLPRVLRLLPSRLGTLKPLFRSHFGLAISAAGLIPSNASSEEGYNE